MKLTLTRMWDNVNETLGILSIDDVEQCLILEDQYQKEKVYGETRIPEGTYKIKLRTNGRMHEDYSKKYDFHRGMLELQNVPNFKYVYIHVGNDDDDTLGCLITGRKVVVKSGKIKLESSTEAYKELYKKVIPFIDNLYIQIIDK